MPTVPRYGAGGATGPHLRQTLAALPPAYQDIRTNVEMFGASQARALEAAGIGLGNLSDTIGAVAEDRLLKANEAAAGKARAALSNYITESLYGPEGFMGREGEVAVGTYPRQQTDFDRRVRELQDGLPTAEAQRRFRETTQEQVAHARRAMAQHVGSQRESVHTRIADAELASATGLALKGYADPEMLKQALADGAGVIRRHNAERGLPDEVSADQIAGFTEGVFDQIVGRVAKEDPALIAALGRAPLTGDAAARNGVSETSVPSEAPLWWQGASATARDAALASADRQIGDQRLMFRTDVNQRVKTEIRHHRAGLVMPSDTPVTQADIDAAYSPDKAVRIWEDLQQYREFGDLMRHIAMRDPAEIQAMLNEERIEAEEQGGVAADRYALMRQARAADAKARHRNPAAYVIARSAGLQALWGMEGPDGNIGDLTPDEMQRAMRATWEAEAEIGVPVADRRAMPNQAAAAFAGHWLKETDPEARLDSLLAIIPAVGAPEAAESLAVQLIEAGLPKEIPQVFRIARDPLRRQSAVTVMRSLTSAAPPLSDGQGADLRSALLVEWRTSPGPLRWLSAVLARDGAGIRFSIDEKALFDRVARMEMATGDVEAAVDRASGAIYGARGQRDQSAMRVAADLMAMSRKEWQQQVETAETESLLQLLSALVPDMADETGTGPSSTPSLTGKVGRIDRRSKGADLSEHATYLASSDLQTEADHLSDGVEEHAPRGDSENDARASVQSKVELNGNQGNITEQGLENIRLLFEINERIAGTDDPMVMGILREMISVRSMGDDEIRSMRTRISAIVSDRSELFHAFNEVLDSIEHMRIIDRPPVELMNRPELFYHYDRARRIADVAGGVSIVGAVAGPGASAASMTAKIFAASFLASPLTSAVIGSVSFIAGEVIKRHYDNLGDDYEEEIRRRGLNPDEPPQDELNRILPTSQPLPGNEGHPFPVLLLEIPSHDPMTRFSRFFEPSDFERYHMRIFLYSIFRDRDVSISEDDAEAIINTAVTTAEEQNTPASATLRWMLSDVEERAEGTIYGDGAVARYRDGQPVLDADSRAIMLPGSGTLFTPDEEMAELRSVIAIDAERDLVIERIVDHFVAHEIESEEHARILADRYTTMWRENALDGGPSITDQAQRSGVFAYTGRRRLQPPGSPEDWVRRERTDRQL